MTHSNLTFMTHPILAELGLTLPGRTDTCWTAAGLNEDGSSLRITFVADNDLIIEFLKETAVTSRYVFDSSGHLIAAYNNAVPEEALLNAIKSSVLHSVSTWLHAQGE